MQATLKANEMKKIMDAILLFCWCYHMRELNDLAGAGGLHAGNLTLQVLDSDGFGRRRQAVQDSRTGRPGVSNRRQGCI